MRGVLPHMAARGRGSIVATASVAGLTGVPNIPSYSAVKGGVIALTRQVAVDFAPQGIRVNAICPGTVRTALVDAAPRERRGDLKIGPCGASGCRAARPNPSTGAIIPTGAVIRGWYVLLQHQSDAGRQPHVDESLLGEF